MVHANVAVSVVLAVASCALMARTWIRRRATSQTHKKVPIFVVTGGPCSGKTSGMAFLRDHFKQLGYAVLVVPEVATLFFHAGVGVKCDTEEQRIQRQCSILATMLHLENTFQSIAAVSSSPTVILCDRGAMDGRAYCTESQWESVIARVGVTNDSLLRRYQTVVHLVTAASGASDSYNMTNGARYEALDEARRADAKTLQAWAQHPNVSVIDNSTPFPEKMHRAFTALQLASRPT